MRNKGVLTNIDNSDLAKYPNGRIKNNTGAGDGTPVNEEVYGDIHEAKDKLMRLYGISHNGLPDNETNGYQLIDALVALASKNDFTLPLNLDGGVLTVPLKLSKLKDNETFILKASVNKTTETHIKGTLDGVNKVIVFLGDFKANEYVRMINASSSVILVRMIDSFNLGAAIEDLGYLKKATLQETVDGIINTKAVTPEAFLGAFAEYVIGLTSGNFLADDTRNGLYSKEHFDIVENLSSTDSNEKNYGTFSPANINSTTPIGTSVPVSGDLVSALVSANTNDGEEYTITLANSMDDMNYQVRLSVESLGGSIDDDNNLQEFVWKKISTTSFKILIEQTDSGPDNIKVHIEVIQR